MKTWRVVWGVAGFASGLAVMAGLVALVLGRENLALRTQLAEAAAGERERAAEQARLSAQLSQTESRLAEVQRQLEEWRAQARARNEAAATSAAPVVGGKVHVFAGGRYVGTGRLAGGSTGGAEPHVYLEGPTSGGPGETRAPVVAAGAAFSGMQWMSGWPWLWMAGGVVEAPTNGPTVQLPLATPPPAPSPAANPPPSRSSGSVAAVRPAGWRGLWVGGLRPPPQAGLPRIPNLPPSVPRPQVTAAIPTAGQPPASVTSRRLSPRVPQSGAVRANPR